MLAPITDPPTYLSVCHTIGLGRRSQKQFKQIPNANQNKTTRRPGCLLGYVCKCSISLIGMGIIAAALAVQHWPDWTEMLHADRCPDAARVDGLTSHLPSLPSLQKLEFWMMDGTGKEAPLILYFWASICWASIAGLPTTSSPAAADVLRAMGASL